MANIGSLVSPGVSVTVTDESFYIAAGAVTTPLIFIATQSEKKQPNMDPALGTYEHHVIRKINSLTQSIATYGVPYFGDEDVPRYHGDCRNEYGLLALNRFLGVGSGAYVVRAGVNLNDDRTTLNDMWDTVMKNALTGDDAPPLGVSVVLKQRIDEYMDNYNADNGLQNDDDPRYKTSINKTEFQTIVTDVLEEIMGVQAHGSQVWFENDTFKSTRPTFFEDRSANPLGVYADQDFTNPPSYSFLGVLGFINAEDGANFSPGTGGNTLVTSYDASESGALVFNTAGSPGSSNIIRRTDGLGWVGVSAGDKIVIRNAEDLDNNGVFTVVDLHISGSPTVWDTLEVTPAAGDIVSNIDDTTAIIEVYREASSGYWTSTEAQIAYENWVDDYLNTREFVRATTLGGTDAQRRAKIVEALAAATNPANIPDLTSETYEYNLILCPGFHEIDDEMISLSQAIGEEALVIGETPFNKNPEDVAIWSKRSNAYGLIAYYYPHGLVSNVDGAEVFTTAASSALRVIAYNDKNANIWDAPAGTQRGGVSDLSQVGYVTGTLGTDAATFVPVALNKGQQKTLYEANINPIVYFPNRGITVWGQKTSNPNTSALDRVNVAREVMYIRRKVRKSALPYVFQPNDQITRDQVKAMVDAFLSNIMANRGLYDFLVICDATNNTAYVLDNNSLVCDILIKPTKTAEFLYFPIKVLSSGATLG